MSITAGIEIRKPDPRDENYDHNAWSSWKNRYFDIWVGDWLRRHCPCCPTYYCHGEYQSIIIPKEALLQMADDLINHRFDAAPDYAEEVEELGEYGPGFGEEFRALAEKIKDDEVLIHYWVLP